MQQQLYDFEQSIKNEGAKKYLIKLFVLIVLYIASAYFGLSLAVSFDQITTIWPATGIAITALLIWGYHYAPGVFAGALLVNVFNDTSPIVSTAMAIGNSIEAILAVYLIHRFMLGIKLLEKISSIIKFVLLVCIMSTMASATIGVLSLLVGGYIETAQATYAWLTWWVGDMIGALVIVPFVLAWRDSNFRELLAEKLFDGVFIFIVAATVCLIVFSQPSSVVHITSTLVYLVFPLIIWASVRLLQIGAVTTAAIVSIAAVWGTVAGTGPYTRNDSIELNLVLLHIFIFTIMVTGLVLAVSVSERLMAEKELRQKAIELEEAKNQILHNIKWRKDLQKQMKDAASQINNIIGSVFEERSKDPPK
jgi:integral membrane sensor domain MASE1